MTGSTRQLWPKRIHSARTPRALAACSFLLALTGCSDALKWSEDVRLRELIGVRFQFPPPIVFHARQWLQVAYVVHQDPRSAKRTAVRIAIAKRNYLIEDD